MSDQPSPMPTLPSFTRIRRTARWLAALALCMPLGLASGHAQAAGTLTPVGSSEAPIEIIDHQVDVVIQNGFARTQVSQTFHNSNSYPVEAIYSFPIPESASLAEVTLQIGEDRIDGEVVPQQQAQRIYEEERSKGNDAGLATQNEYKTFDFAVSRVLPNRDVQMRFVYYQPLSIDTGIGRYVYPLEDGGTDDRAAQFWIPNEKVAGNFSVDVEIKSAWPIADVRVPGLESRASIKRVSEERFEVSLNATQAELSRDFVLYYRLADDLPGRVEVIPYRADPTKPGTFMAVVTPGIDLRELDRGADYVFVLDTSGSMAGKLATLTAGVERSLRQMKPEDRFRVLEFSTTTRDVLGGWWNADSDSVERAAERLRSLQADGGTNIYDALQLATGDLDADRATSVVLVTDGVTNTGVVDPKQFRALLKQLDIRVFGFLMGNSANWPLMQTISDASGGFYATVSNADDIIGQILLAKSKMTHEALHDASFDLRGSRTSDVTGLEVGKIYRGQQLVLFGRYHEAGPATLELRATLTGEDKTYTTEFEFPERDTENPELERLWALAMIQDLQLAADLGQIDSSEADDAVRDLGVQYQVVTEETAMLVLSDTTFEDRGIERRNRARVERERSAQAARSTAPTTNRRVDASKPTYSTPAPRLRGGGGGGAIDPVSGLFVLALGASACMSRRRSTDPPAPDAETHPAEPEA